MIELQIDITDIEDAKNKNNRAVITSTLGSLHETNHSVR